MRSETNHLKSEHQERSKQQSDRKKDGSMSPTYISNQRRSSASDDDISSLQPLKNGPNENTADVDNDDDDENENYEEGEDYVSDTDYLVQWTGPRKNMPVVLFRADAILEKESSAKCVGEKYRLAFKIVRTECKIVRSVLVSHGFHEVHPNSLDFNVMWTGSHIKPYVLRGFSEFQKVNHFPRSYELTRKDRLCKNVQRMQHLKGFKHFDFIPLTFITPIEYGDFQSTFTKEKGIWIVKPVASSRGRGIFLINHPSQVPMDETLIVSRYISNPLLIDDFKFDIRLYVLVTSYDPMIIYLYEEGLARFASQKFDKSAKSVKNQFMHLTNYSVNKRNPDFVKNADPDLEDYGNKWSMSAMLRYLKSIGHDTAALMMRIEDLIVKTFLAGEMAIASASNMFQPFRGNCFELYGFDVLVDENMKPWLMEVNLSPSLACDAPIDLKIKANMVSDLFSVVGVTAQDPVSRRLQLRKGGSSEAQNRNAIKQQQPYLDYQPLLRARGGANSSLTKNGGRSGGGAPFAGGGGRRQHRNQSGGHSNSGENLNPLTNEEAKILRLAREEYGRRGRWIRIFPTPVSWESYGNLMEHRTTHNLMLFTRLFPNGRTKAGSCAPSRPSSAYPSSSSGVAANYSNGRPRSAAGMAAAAAAHKMNSAECNETTTTSGCTEIISRLLQYERRLMTLAETRAVSAANGNRRVNSESFALNVAAQHDASGGGGAGGSRINLSGGNEGRPRSRSRLAQGVESQSTANGTGGAGAQQHNRKQTRSLSSGTRGSAATNTAAGEHHNRHSAAHRTGGNKAAAGSGSVTHEREISEKTVREDKALRNRSSAPDEYRVANDERDHRHSKSSRSRSEMKQNMLSSEGADVVGRNGHHRHRRGVAADDRHGRIEQQQQQNNDNDNDVRGRRRNKYLTPADADVSKTPLSNRSGSGASYSAHSGDRSKSGGGGSSRSRSRSGSSAGTRTHSSRSSSSSSSSSSSTSSFDTDNSSVADEMDAEKSKAQIRSLLEQGHIFTVTQARLAFAAYLVRVHRRLLRESQQAADDGAGTAAGTSAGGRGGSSLGALEKELRRDSGEKQLDNESSDAQMDLVLRFLKRAAQNLSQVFRVVVPSKKLSIQERRRILAKQLSDFVTIYSKDTNTISAAQHDKNKQQQQPNNNNNSNQASTSSAGAAAIKIPIADQIFQQFLEVSNENDLEEVLTLFTKINRSASIFLGGIQHNNPSSSFSSAAAATTQSNGAGGTNHHQRTAATSGSLRGSHGGSTSGHHEHHQRHSSHHVAHSSDVSASMAATQTTHRDSGGAEDRQQPPHRSSAAAAANNDNSSTDRSTSCRIIQAAASSSRHNNAAPTSTSNAASSGGGGGGGKMYSNNQLSANTAASNSVNEVSRESTHSHISSKYSTVGLVLDATGHAPKGAVEALAALHMNASGKRPPSGLGLGLGLGLGGAGILYDKSCNNMYGQGHQPPPTVITTGGGAHMEQPPQQRDKSVERRDRSVERELYLKDTKTLLSNQKPSCSPPPRAPVQTRVAFDSVQATVTTPSQTRDQSTTATAYSSSSAAAYRSSRQLDSSSSSVRRGGGRTRHKSRGGGGAHTSPDAAGGGGGGAPFVTPSAACFSTCTMGGATVDESSFSSSSQSPSLLSYLQQHTNGGYTGAPCAYGDLASQPHPNPHLNSHAPNYNFSYPNNLNGCTLVSTSPLPSERLMAGAVTSTGVGAVGGSVVVCRPNSSSRPSRTNSASSAAAAPVHKAGGAGGTPLNRGKKPRPFSAHMDQTARIYSENLTRTMIPLNVGNGSSNGASGKSQHSAYHHQPVTMTTSAGGAMVSQKSEEAINQALQRLAKRQATRQYSATNATGSIFKQNLAGEDSTINFADSSPLLVSPRPPPRQECSAPPLQWDSDDHATAYSLVTGVAPTTSYQATPGSTQYEVVQHQHNRAGGGGGTQTAGTAASVVCATGGIFSRPNSGNTCNNKNGNANSSALNNSSSKKPVVIVKNINGVTQSNNDNVPSLPLPRPSTAKTSYAASDCSEYYNESNQVVFVNPRHSSSHSEQSRQSNNNNNNSSSSRRPQSNTAGSNGNVGLLVGHEDSPYYCRPTRASSANRRAKANLLPTTSATQHNHR